MHHCSNQPLANELVIAADAHTGTPVLGIVKRHTNFACSVSSKSVLMMNVASRRRNVCKWAHFGVRHDTTSITTRLSCDLSAAKFRVNLMPERRDFSCNATAMQRPRCDTLCEGDVWEPSRSHHGPSCGVTLLRILPCC